MNRTDFMTQLERLLRSISPSEREEALQYYNDYFDDAGEENEQAVIEALGNPARVAENIKRDLPGSAGENTRVRATASDRAVIEYGKADPAEPKPEDGEPEEKLPREQDPSQKSYFEDESLLRREPLTAAGTFGQSSASGRGGSAGQGGMSDSGVNFGRESVPGQSRSADDAFGSGGGYGKGDAPAHGGTAGRSGKPGKSGMAGWLIVLITIGVILGSPFAIGVLSLLFAMGVTWFVFIFVFGLVALVMFIMLVALLAVGIQCMFLDPLVGIALIGAGMVCGGLGILFLMLTVALTGIVTPAIFRGVGWLLRGGARHDRKKEATA